MSDFHIVTGALGYSGKYIARHRLKVTVGKPTCVEETIAPRASFATQVGNVALLSTMGMGRCPCQIEFTNSNLKPTATKQQARGAGFTPNRRRISSDAEG